ncbi:unnamed protein product [Acanthocheilonema viteae]|uniref:Uncharacterized protein n=1 Tax=Acanthocheilonema viteae TaxID=6277 RepID=A0A498SNK3_ACAVI|nr:unnamed protein product [Acanthocheilonema viteae]
MFRSAAVSEWLRSLIRNQMGSARVGSNPARCALSLTRNQMGSARAGSNPARCEGFISVNHEGKSKEKDGVV